MRSWRLAALLVGIALVAAACAGDGESGGDSGDGATSNEKAPATPPEVDLSSHSVPLDDVHFDTFDGGSVPLSESTPELRARLLDAIPPIDRPVYGDVSASDWLAPNDLVVGYIAGGETYAYPFKILNFHEIVNDEIDGVPVLISYCPLCRSAIVYDRRVGGEILSFGNTSALFESDLVMVDRNTGSYWWQVAGSAIVGPLTDTVLEPLPSVVATWKDWTSQHPDTRVLTRDTGYSRPYEQDSFAGYADAVDAGRFPFPVGEAARDDRLQPSALVVGVILDRVARAYPVEGMTDAINDEVGGEPIVVFPIEGGAAVFSAVVDGETLEFLRTDARFVDSATGSIWTPAGVAVSGWHTGAALDPVPSRTTFWFAFVGAFPDVQVHTG